MLGAPIGLLVLKLVFDTTCNVPKKLKIKKEVPMQNIMELVEYNVHRMYHCLVVSCS